MPMEVVFYAPNVHAGGGFVLLQNLLEAWPPSKSLRLILDARVKGRLSLPELASVHWVAPRVLARLTGEITAMRAAREGALLFCFHGLPPVLPSRARVIVFLQNRLYLGSVRLAQFPVKTRLRLMFERSIGRLFRHRVSEYIVQTPSMQREVLDWFGAFSRRPQVRVAPFIGDIAKQYRAEDGLSCRWDFAYVADGAAHKNHRSLVEAWRLLAEEGVYPSLVLTLGPRDALLAQELLAIAARYGLRIENQGELTRDGVVKLYAQTGALVYPSLVESFGLPLIEASLAGKPIVASELDYVRDVCAPTQTFDPGSATSIARAVCRHLRMPCPIQELLRSEQFWAMLLGSIPQVRAD